MFVVIWLKMLELYVHKGLDALLVLSMVFVAWRNRELTYQLRKMKYSRHAEAWGFSRRSPNLMLSVNAKGKR